MYIEMTQKKRTFEENEDSDALVNDSAFEDDEIYQKECGRDALEENYADIETQKPVIGCRQSFTDCSNVFKAFIGSALIGLPFAVLQAGVGLSLILLVIIGFATDYCCALIVKCKKMVIANICRERMEQGVHKESIKEEAELLGRTLSFGRIGKACLGRSGLLAVNISIMVTQFGFCIGYFIFLGNTMRTVLKYFLIHSNDTISNLTTTAQPLTTTTVQPLTTVLTTTLMTSTSFLPTTTLMTSTSSLSTTPSSTINITTTANNTFDNIMRGAANSTFTHLHAILKEAVKEPLSPKNLLLNSYSTFAVLLLIPLPILVVIAFIRNLRKLGPISVIANASITLAFAATASYVLSQMEGLPTPFYWFRASTFPIFFGQVTGAFEGIGTVIPIEGSMAENRHKYPLFLHISLTLLSLILGTFGIVGYLKFGDHTCQIITSNLHGPIAIALQLLLFIGVLFTYPLQLYPCIQITEHLVIKYRKWRLARGNKYRVMRENINEEADNLIESDEKPPELVVKGELENEKANMFLFYMLKTWEGNIIRTMLVIITAAIALVFRSQFAYIAALTGSVGSSLLSFILPPIFHMSLLGFTKMSAWGRAKDIFFVLFGIVGGTMGLSITIREITDAFTKGHPPHC